MSSQHHFAHCSLMGLLCFFVMRFCLMSCIVSIGRFIVLFVDQYFFTSRSVCQGCFSIDSFSGCWLNYQCSDPRHLCFYLCLCVCMHLDYLEKRKCCGGETQHVKLLDYLTCSVRYEGIWMRCFINQVFVK